MANFYLLYEAGNNGSITGNLDQVVAEGASGTPVEAVPNLGFQFVNWSDASTANPRTDTNVLADLSVTANFAVATFNLEYTAGTGGSITGTASQTVNYEANGESVTATPLDHYSFVQWSDLVTEATRQELSVTSDLSVEAEFTIDQVSVTYTAGDNGSITGETEQSVDYDGTGTQVTAVPATGYHFVEWSDLSVENPRTDENVTTEIDVTATFAINEYTLDYAVDGGNGSITGDLSQTVNHGANGTPVTAEPAPNYHFVGWSDEYQGANRTDLAVTGNINVTATFAIDTFDLTYVAGEGGSITGDNPQTVNYGGDGTEVTAVPDAHYEFVSWSDNFLTANRTDETVTEDITVTANFAAFEFVATYTAGDNGSIVGTNPQTIALGADGTEVVATPAENYHFVSWSDEYLTANRTDLDVSDTITVTATFAIDTYAVEFTAGTGGTISLTGTQTIDHGSDCEEVTAVASTGYHFVNWIDGDEVEVTTDETIAITNVTEAASYTAVFDPIVGVVVTPARAYVQLGTNRRFDAYVTGDDENEVPEITWTVSGTAGGTVTPSGNSGIYSPANVGDAIITATSIEDETKTGTASITVGSMPKIERPFNMVILKQQ